MIEIERKFLLKAMPDVLPTEVVKIDQFYFKNKEGVWERVRQWNSNLYGKRWIHTIKTKISEHKQLGFFWRPEEVDIFKDKCHIIIAEIEIPSEDYDLNIPEFISKKTLLEVTGQKLFSNRSLSVKLK